MGQVLHRSATTTEAVRRAIQHSQESLRALAQRHGINPKTVAKWKKRESTADRRAGSSSRKLPARTSSTGRHSAGEALCSHKLPFSRRLELVSTDGRSGH